MQTFNGRFKDKTFAMVVRTSSQALPSQLGKAKDGSGAGQNPSQNVLIGMVWPKLQAS